MYSETFMVDDCQVAQFYSALVNLRKFLGGANYRIEHRIQLTFSTEDHRLADAVRAIIRPEERPDLVPIVEAQPAAQVLSEAHPAIILPPGSKASTIERPEPEQGLVSCNPADKSAICENCQQPFIRRQKDQRYCCKPDCQKAKIREYAHRAWEKKKNGHAVSTETGAA